MLVIDMATPDKPLLKNTAVILGTAMGGANCIYHTMMPQLP